MGRDIDERFDKLVTAVGMAVLAVVREAGPGALRGVRLTELRAKLDADEGTSVLLIIKGVSEGGKVIGFVGANTLDSGLVALRKKLDAGVLRWREDVPWAEGR